ncbi:hypothetical protein L208DRAFT_1405325 [Tricholoma matsutake]|nr:hypothetical protein L208DRAFT_1405325 [Tricholoma matsutake 945]
MDLPEGNCTELVEKTAAVLDKKALQALFVSTQRNQIELSFGYAVQANLMNILSAAATFKLKQIFSSAAILQDWVSWVEALCDWFPVNVSITLSVNIYNKLELL